ncbi:hypothetical protein LTR48_002495 [Friedmanniomyces endolithicus]|uniref:Transcription factor domain-containing protein n=1 Tax=Rachicladosporium monterosium TaxID=1507873 RepID=A0ABR0LDH5_9PEZI|nr:hypothetical protein LTR48_002495 [Friedmanniomyces endolithicus]KAK5147137.1 hypothetical protein LTR32_001385 [Rachicladosporium monterosium]
MHEIPRRLGVSEALDAAVATVVEAHSTFCSRRPATTRGLLLYSKALSNLRASLDDVGTACSNETLCAVMILMACQSLMGLNSGAWTGHSEGAIKLLKARGPPDPDDMFETELVMCVRAPALEGIFNEEIEMMLPDPPGSRYSEVSVLNIVSQTQSLIRRWSGPHGLGLGDATIVEDAKECYKVSQDAIEEWRAIATAMDASMELAKPQPLALVHEHARVHQYLGLLVAVTIILNCIVSVIDRDHCAKLIRERTALIFDKCGSLGGIAVKVVDCLSTSQLLSPPGSKITAPLQDTKLDEFDDIRIKRRTPNWMSSTTFASSAVDPGPEQSVSHDRAKQWKEAEQHGWRGEQTLGWGADPEMMSA